MTLINDPSSFRDDAGQVFNFKNRIFRSIKNNYVENYNFLKNQDIYKIGITQNLLQRFEQLKPDQVINTIRCSNYKELERELHNILNNCRIPQTEYFRLTPTQVEEVNQLMTTKAKF